MMPWFPGDFMRSTRGWSVTARGVYRELLDAQWDLGSLPSDVDELCRMIAATPDEWLKGWVKCQPKFPVGEDGQRRNPRLEQHRLKSVDLSERRKKGAEKTNAQRYGERTSHSSDSASLSATHSDQSVNRPALASISDPSPSPILSDKTGRKSAARSPACRLPDDFGLTEEMITHARGQRCDPQRTFEAFCDYWHAASGPKARKHDWIAAWRTWCRTEADRRGSSPRGANPVPNHDAAWAEAKSKARAIGFRDPLPVETPTSYLTAIRQAENARPIVPIAQRLGLAGIKRIGQTAP
jgi:uncharacterized protein YdaU (DUF1376 family)